jgi:hypothetical protein
MLQLEEANDALRQNNDALMHNSNHLQQQLVAVNNSYAQVAIFIFTSTM